MAINKSSLSKVVLAIGCMGMLLAIGLPMSAFAPDAKKGKATFDESCSACHNAASTEELVGPGLKGLFKKAKLTNGKAVNEMNVRDVVNKGGDVMPAFADTLNMAQKDDLIAYLKTL